MSSLSNETPQPIPFIDAIREGITECCQPRLQVSAGKGCEILMDDPAIVWMTTELVNNCAEKDSPEAIEVSVAFDFNEDSQRFSLVVTDNVSYPPEQLAVIIKQLNKKYTKKAGKTPLKQSSGGFGKYGVQTILQRWGGIITYTATQDNKVMAHATWQKEHFLNPLPPLEK